MKTPLYPASLFLALLFSTFASATSPYTPFYAKYFLVAGSGDSDFKDGVFLSAAFKVPGGLALSKDQSTLYVADTGNNAIRAVALDRQHRVSTLLSEAKAGLAGPTQLQLSPDGQTLYLLDQDQRALRRLTLRSKELKTLAEAPEGLKFSSLAADAQLDRLYLTSGDQLILWDSQGSRSLGSDPALDCPEGRLVLLDRELFFCNPCNGRIHRIQVRGERFPGRQPLHDGAMAPLTVQAFEPYSLTPTAAGFTAMEEGPGNWKILYWDPGRAGLIRYNPGGGDEPYVMSDYQGTTLTGPSADMVGINATSDRRQLLKPPLALVAGPAGLVYAAEAASNRVLGVDTQLLFHNGADINHIRTGRSKPKNSTRLMVVGSSLIYYWRDYTPEKRYNVNLSFVRQLETHLNLEGGLKGLGRRFEVMSQTDQLGYMSGGTATFFLARAGQLKDRQVDEVLLVIDTMSLSKEIFAFAGTRTVDDLASGPYQADWASLSPAERQKEYGPLTRALISDVRADPKRFKGYLEVDTQGDLRLLKRDREIMTLPRIQAYGGALMRKALQKCQVEALRHGARLSIVLWPTRDLVEIGEIGGDDYYQQLNSASMDRPLAEAAASLGIRCYNLTEPTRLLAMPFFPLVNPGDHHFNFRAHGWLASLLARQMTQSK